MTDVASPLHYGDPPNLGPFVLQARLRSEPAGLVYLAYGPDQRPVSVAVLTRGAALDAAARERFVTSIRAAASGHGGTRGGVRGLWARAVRGRAPRVIAMSGGRAPWVATPHVPGRAGAEWFLAPVMVSGTLIGERHGPDFVPYWLPDRSPAVPPPPPPPPPPTETRRAVTAAASVLTGLTALLAVVLLLLFGAESRVEQPRRPLPPTVYEPTPPPVPTQRPETPTPKPTPGETGTGTPAPSPDDTDEGAPI
ncbi:hypothetical protein SAMN05421505_118109 [Sinosporangium album]|uniref:Uncharacterized protein n=1 Tax=Sinosporangium album TaxID=504805 RepID=A0A1G8DNE0_9ACTN|nr:hypothetical protein [Sinosporangium album]SDH59039.1 hypothetical protein SAMN05421505_118109 [Sinosporangium album]